MMCEWYMGLEDRTHQNNSSITFYLEPFTARRAYLGCLLALESIYFRQIHMMT